MQEGSRLRGVGMLLHSNHLDGLAEIALLVRLSEDL
jgi:hypothetical protein